VLIACLSIVVVVVIMRTLARYGQTRKIPLAPEDLFIYVSLGSFAITCALDLASMPTYDNVMAVEAGSMAPYTGFLEDATVMRKESFTWQIFFWLTLWAVKWSLLFMCKGLTAGSPLQTKIWWGVLAFTILTLIGGVVSTFLTCGTWHAGLTAGEFPHPHRSEEDR
jgi:hypothetical protein